ncbi:MAG: hypothetical protein KJI69_01115 [Patescibacteria group bacterium]|nr:hypothetical protein [Patescibacteria group bacterium]
MTDVSITTETAYEPELRGSIPWVIQLYPGVRGENLEFYAIHLWNRIQEEARVHPPDPYAQMACNQTLGLFGTFLVLLPGGQTSTKGIRDLLEDRSQKWPWNGASPPGPHTVLLAPKQARRKTSFFNALLEVLISSESTGQAKEKQKLAASLVAMFFSGHPSKMRELAKLVSSGVHYGGHSSISVDD